MTVRQVCFWQHNYFKKIWASKRLLMGFVSHLGKKLLLSGLLDGVLYKLDMQDPKKWLFNLPKTGEMVLWGPYFMKKSARHSVGHRRKWLTNCQYRWNCLSNFLLHEKVCQILWACRLKMNAPMVQKNFGWLYSQRDVSVISRVWSCLFLV